jgi:hypothetical protein
MSELGAAWTTGLAKPLSRQHGWHLQITEELRRILPRHGKRTGVEHGDGPPQLLDFFLRPHRAGHRT